MWTTLPGFPRDLASVNPSAATDPTTLKDRGMTLIAIGGTLESTEQLGFGYIPICYQIAEKRSVLIADLRFKIAN
jgi:hypothetical protein